MKTFLKVRIKELAEEARIIRKEELKAKASKHYAKLNGLHHHRVQIVRPAARAAQLAYGYLRGRPYRTMEAAPRTEPDWKDVRRIVAKFGDIPNDGDLEKAIEVWRNHE